VNREKCYLSNFRHAADGASFVVIKADFDYPACGRRFQEQFGGMA